MSARWLSIRVDLVSGRGQTYDPGPGRVFAVPSSTTFEDLALAIDAAFGRWDLAHLRQFTLADGTEVSDPESGIERLESPIGPIPKTKWLSARIGGSLRNGDQFRYVFDFGDGWTQNCVVEGRADPPYGPDDRPVITWGWGSLPDQYGRRWADDDGSSVQPPDPAKPEFHDQPDLAPIDIRAFRAAVLEADPKRLVDTISGVDLDHALQQVGAGLLRTRLEIPARTRNLLDPYLLSVLNRLTRRDWEGDGELGELILAVLQDASPEVRRVDLDELVLTESLDGAEPGVYVNSQTGEVAPAFLTDEAIVGEDVVVDVEDGAWIYLDEDQTRGHWQDMADFAATQDPRVRALLEEAIEGKGAFSRFRAAVHRAELAGLWTVYSDDRRIGRARAALIRHDLRPV